MVFLDQLISVPTSAVLAVLPLRDVKRNANPPFLIHLKMCLYAAEKERRSMPSMLVWDQVGGTATGTERWVCDTLGGERGVPGHP